ncbi:MAG: hypothetical protein H6R05_1246 [Burkholderiaceae bacterium]|nr:hypothetical protein [Burkholderiaceae bacterium]
MKLSTLFTAVTLSAGLWFSAAAFAQNEQPAPPTLPQKAAVAQQNQAMHPNQKMDAEQGCNMVKPSCDMPKKAQKQHKKNKTKKTKKTRQHAVRSGHKTSTP